MVGSLKFTHLARLQLKEPFKGPVLRETRLLPDLGERVRDVRQGPDGLIYLLTDHPNGRLIRLSPAPWLVLTARGSIAVAHTKPATGCACCPYPS